MNTEHFVVSSYKKQVENLSVTYKSPSNIALVKYWGKSDPQLPKNASISFTLNESCTTTTIHFKKMKLQKETSFELFFEGEKREDFKPKIVSFFKKIQQYCPYILEYEMTIESSNSFPHSSGIASSASGMSAIAMCLMDLENHLMNGDLTDTYIKQKASFLARLGSGSASRSIEGPLVVWGKHPDIKESSDLYGIRFTNSIHSVFDNYQDTILLVDKGKKQVSSSVGHKLMHGHPFANQRFLQANENISELIKYLTNGNIDEFIKLVESEALTLHAMMLTSNPYFILMKPNTLEIINKVWNYRKEKNSKLCFTLDAGANVHLLYPYKEKDTVLQFVKNELSNYCEKKQYICDNVGFGAKKI